jgi:magnesium-transporting ATPase (P-type)
MPCSIKVASLSLKAVKASSTSSMLSTQLLPGLKPLYELWIKRLDSMWFSINSSRHSSKSFVIEGRTAIVRTSPTFGYAVPSLLRGTILASLVYLGMTELYNHPSKVLTTFTFKVPGICLRCVSGRPSTPVAFPEESFRSAVSSVAAVMWQGTSTASSLFVSVS